MKTPKHTLGPWVALPYSRSNRCYVTDGERVIFEDTALETGAVTADARLIAAAPDLLLLLQEIEAWFSVNNMPLSPGTVALSDSDDTALQSIRAVIAKATGGAE
jgi:hypothetical protein